MNHARMLQFGTALLVAAMGVTAIGSGAQPPPAKPPGVPPDAEKISDNVYRIGAVVVDLKARSITCPAKFNLQKGVIEYLAVAPRGKLHESVLEVEVRPLHLQLGLILLGLEPGGGLSIQGDAHAPKGPPVEVWVAWQRGGREVRVRGEELAWDIKREKPMEANPWVFSGSRVTQQGFLADREKSLIATYRDPAAIVNNRLPSGADDTVYEANEKLVPRPGTAAELSIQVPGPPPGPKPPAGRGSG